jgi:hypothetical protein
MRGWWSGWKNATLCRQATLFFSHFFKLVQQCFPLSAVLTQHDNVCVCVCVCVIYIYELYINIYTCVCVCVCVCVYNIYIRIMCVCVYVCVCVCVCIYIVLAEHDNDIRLFFRKHAREETHHDAMLDNFVKSCAGYCACILLLI